MKWIISFLGYVLLTSAALAQIALPFPGPGGVAAPAFSLTFQSSSNNAGSSNSLGFGSMPYSAGCTRLALGITYYGGASPNVATAALTGAGTATFAQVPNALVRNAINSVAIDVWESTGAATGTSGTLTVTFDVAIGSGGATVAIYCLTTTTPTRTPTPQTAANGFATTVDGGPIVVPSGGGGLALAVGGNGGTLSSLTNTGSLQTVATPSPLNTYYANITSTGSTTVRATYGGADFLAISLVTWAP